MVNTLKNSSRAVSFGKRGLGSGNENGWREDRMVKKS